MTDPTRPFDGPPSDRRPPLDRAAGLDLDPATGAGTASDGAADGAEAGSPAEPAPGAGPWWGTAAAATQCEGAAPRSDWARWEAEGRVPPSGDGNGFRTRYADDLALLAAHGVRHHRLTVEWARLEPSPGRWADEEVDHLHRVFDAARDAGVAVWVCLLHGSAPGWFTDDQRGWLDDKAGLVWARHVDRVAEAIGDRVAGWVPIHEPEALARLGHLVGELPPGRRSPEDHHDARAALLAAEAEAARLLRSGRSPVAVTARPGHHHDGDDLVVVRAPADGLERPLDRLAGGAPHARVLVVTDAGPTGDGDSTGDDEERRAARLRGAVELLADADRGAVPVVGAFHQPAVDGYEWHRGTQAHLGLFDRDRRPRPALDALARR